MVDAKLITEYDEVMIDIVDRERALKKMYKSFNTTYPDPDTVSASIRLYKKKEREIREALGGAEAIYKMRAEVVGSYTGSEKKEVVAEYNEVGESLDAVRERLENWESNTPSKPSYMSYDDYRNKYDNEKYDVETLEQILKTRYDFLGDMLGIENGVAKNLEKKVDLKMDEVHRIVELQGESDGYPSEEMRRKRR